MREYKVRLEPAEWYSFKREYPTQYRILKGYIREATWYTPIRHESWGNREFVEAVLPRWWFTRGKMMTFLLRHRHLKEYTHLHFTEVTTYQGKKTVRIGWDDAVLGKECDYFWSEVKAVLALLGNLLSCENKK